MPNLKKKKYFIPELNRSMTLTLSTRAIRSIELQGGIMGAIFKARNEDLSNRLKKIRDQIKN